MLLSEAIEKFSNWKKFDVKEQTVKSYDLILRHFCLFLRNPEIEDITIDDIMEWFDLQDQLKWDRNSFIPKAIALRKLLEFYKMQGLEILNPDLIPVPDKEYRQARVLSEENYKKLLAVIPKDGKDPRHIRNEAIIRMLWDCGARNTENCSINVSDLDLEKMQTVIRTEKAKTRKPMRQIFWTESTNEVLKIWLERRAHLFEKGVFADPDALFISISGSKYGKRFTKKGVAEMLRRYSHKAGIPVANAHSFRHNFGHELSRNGANNSQISSMMGHSCLASSFVYTMMNDREMEEAYRKFKPGSQSLGELPARRFEAPPTVKQKRNRPAERAALRIKRAQQRIDYIASRQNEKVGFN